MIAAKFGHPLQSNRKYALCGDHFRLLSSISNWTVCWLFMEFGIGILDRKFVQRAFVSGKSTLGRAFLYSDSEILQLVHRGTVSHFGSKERLRKVCLLRHEGRPPVAVLLPVVLNARGEGACLCFR
jgi:hypothetical protein